MARGSVMGAPNEKGIIETLSNGPIPRVETQHSIGDGMEHDGQIEKLMIDPRAVAPVVGDATVRGRPDGEVEQAKPPRLFRVEETRHILDKTSGTRTKINAGKEISTQHYDVRDLQRQGLKLKEITATDADEPLPAS